MTSCRAADFRVDPGDMRRDAGAHLLVLGVAQALLVVGPGCHQLVAAALQASQTLAQRIGCLARRQRQRPAHAGEQAGVDGIGLGKRRCGTGKVARTRRVDAHVGDIGGLERAAQGAIVASRRLEYHAQVRTRPPRQHGGYRHRTVGDALGLACCVVVDVEMRFADVDSDEPVGYGHGACPCGARSVGAASCNCSGLLRGAGTEPACGLDDQGPNGLPPTSILTVRRHAGTHARGDKGAGEDQPPPIRGITRRQPAARSTCLTECTPARLGALGSRLRGNDAS